MALITSPPVCLFFTAELRRSQELLCGRLYLISTNGFRITNRYIAASGLPGYQDYDNLSRKGYGSIPDSTFLDRNGYEVSTIPVDMSERKGIEGSFYPITPFEVKMTNVVRGDFGIHKDANVPGTSGCIGLVTDIAWEEFKSDMVFFSRQGFKSLPLLVAYSRQRS